MRAQTPIQTALALCACLAAAPSWAVDPDGSNDEAFVVYGHDICDGKEAEVRLTGRDLKLLPLTEEDVRYDVRAVDEDEGTYTFYIGAGPAESEYRFSIVNSDLD